MKPSEFLLVFIIFSVAGRCAISATKDESKGASSKGASSKGVSSKGNSSKGNSSKEASGKEVSKKESFGERCLSKGRSLKKQLSRKDSIKQEATQEESVPTVEVVGPQLRYIYDEGKKNAEYKNLDKDIKDFEKKPANKQKDAVVDATVEFFEKAKNLKGGPDVEKFRSELESHIDEAVNTKKTSATYRDAKKSLKQNYSRLQSCCGGLNRFWFYIAVIVAGFATFAMGIMLFGTPILAVVALAIGGLMLAVALTDFFIIPCIRGLMGKSSHTPKASKGNYIKSD